MAFTVLYDACVLHPAPLRDLLVRLAATSKLFRARWTEQILDECFRSILRVRCDLSMDRLARTRERMIRAVPDCLVEDYASLIPGLALPDPDDCHVLAAAIRCGAQVIVTRNLRDFPAAKMALYDIESQDPDEFLLHLIDLNPVAVVRAVEEQAAALKNPRVSVASLIETLERQGLIQSMVMLRAFL